MQEKIDKLYKAYLNERLDKILVLSKKVENEVKEESPKSVFGDESPLLNRYEIDYFYNGFARVHDPYSNRYNIINKNGEFMSKTWYVKISKKPCNDIFVVDVGNGKSFINTSGNFITDKIYSNVYSFSEGFAAVEENNKWGFIDINGHEICEIKYQSVFDFKEGYAVVNEGNDKYTYIDTKGNPITNERFTSAHSFFYGVANVSKGKKENFIKPNGELLSNIWSDKMPYEYFDIGLCVIFHDLRGMIIGQDGNVLYTDVENFSRSDGTITFVERVNASKVIKHRCVYSVNKDFLLFGEYVVCRNVDLNGYKVSRTFLGKYRLKKDYDTFDIEGRPVKIYGNNIVLYLGKDNILYLYDRKLDEKRTVGSPKATTYDDYAVYYNDYDVTRALLIYNNAIYNFSNYYINKMHGGYNVKISKVLDGYELISKDAFFFDNEDDIRKELAEERERDRKRDEEIKRQKEEAKLKVFKNEVESACITLRKRRKDLMSQLENLLNDIDECNVELFKLEGDNFFEERMKIKDLFYDYGEYKVIKQQYLKDGMLRMIDLSGETFENVKMNGIDFSNTNISFNPRKVYNRDLSGCNFEGVLITPFMDFTGVNIKGCKFGKNMNYRVSHQGSAFFRLAIYDETTTFDGIPFTEIFKDDNISKVM